MLKSVLLSVVHSALPATLTVKEWTTDSSRLLHFSSLKLKKCTMDSSLLMRNASSPLMNFALQLLSTSSFRRQSKSMKSI